jgi:hypothetical protein
MRIMRPSRNDVLEAYARWSHRLHGAPDEDLLPLLIAALLAVLAVAVADGAVLRLLTTL